MKNEIVKVERNEVFTNSMVIAEMLGLDHTKLLRTVKPIVERLKNNSPASPLKFPQKFKETVYINKMNRSYVMYELNEQAYMKLAMHLKGYEKAEMVQDSIIEAFSLMKESLLNHQNASWLSARSEGKAIRSKEMDIVADFVIYATYQGSKSANLYYMNITKMTNKALELLIQTKEGSPLRDLANIMELGYIQMLENRAMQAIQYGMESELPYKYIYKYAKEEVNKLADSLNFNRKALK